MIPILKTSLVNSWKAGKARIPLQHLSCGREWESAPLSWAGRRNRTCASNKEPLCASNVHFAVNSCNYFTGCKTGSPLRINWRPWGSDVHRLDCSSAGRPSWFHRTCAALTHPVTDSMGSTPRTRHTAPLYLTSGRGLLTGRLESLST